jgi:polar amino acid transport system substrate-binding protein
MEAGVVQVAILAKDAPQMIMTAKDGSPDGAEADLARNKAEKLGVKLEFVRSAETYDGVVHQVAAKEADLGVSFFSSDVSRAAGLLLPPLHSPERPDLLPVAPPSPG